MRDEHEESLASQARGAHHLSACNAQADRRHDSNDGRQTRNEYLNFHRPCGFATETVDEKGKIKKQYNDYLTPFEKLQTLTKPEQFLKEGVTMTSLKEVEQRRSDTESAKLMQEKKIKLFRSFSKPGILT